MTQTQKPQSQYLASWLEGEEVTFPSGKKARVIGVDPLSIVQQDGEIPNFFLEAIDANEVSTESLGAKNFSALVAIMNDITRAAFLDPPIVDTRAEQNEGKGLYIGQIGLADKFWLLQKAMGGVEAANVKKFSGTNGASG
jgi:hypothetical protein